MQKLFMQQTVYLCVCVSLQQAEMWTEILKVISQSEYAKEVREMHTSLATWMH